MILAAPPAGGLLGHAFTIAADFVDRRLLASGGAAVFGICLLAFAAGQSFFVLLAAGFIWGAASDAFVHGYEVALVDLYRDELAPVLGRVNAFGAIGDLLGPLTLAAATAVGIGWRSVFVGSSVVMLIYAASIAVQPFPKTRPPIEVRATVAAILTVVRDRRIILLGLIDGLFGLLDEPFLGFAISYLERVRGLSASLSTSIVGIAVAAGFAGFLAVPFFDTRLTRRALLLGFAALLATSIGLLLTATVIPLQALAALGFGFAGAAFYAILQATYLVLRPGQAGTTQAVVSTIGLFEIGFPTLVGMVSDAFGLRAGLGLYAAVPLLILLLLAVGLTPDQEDEYTSDA